MGMRIYRREGKICCAHRPALKRDAKDWLRGSPGGCGQ
jgi:hypothetical protein